MNTAEKYTVIGAGHGGKAMAAHLALMGAEVALWNRTFDHISVIKLRGGIELESPSGGPRGFATIKLVTSDIKEALDHAQVIMVECSQDVHRSRAVLRGIRQRLLGNTVGGQGDLRAQWAG